MKNKYTLKIRYTDNAEDEIDRHYYELYNGSGKMIAKGKGESKNIVDMFYKRYYPVIMFVKEFNNCMYCKYPFYLKRVITTDNNYNLICDDCYKEGDWS